MDSKSTTGDAGWVSLPYRALGNLPAEQVKFFITATRIANDINFLQRLATVLHNTMDDCGEEADATALVVDAFTTMTLLAGKLFEGHKSLSRYAQLWKADSPLKLSGEGKASRVLLSKWFANGSALSRVRNSVSFHYDTKELLDREVSLFNKSVASDDTLRWIQGQRLSNTFYTSTAAGNALEALAEAYPDEPDRMKAFFRDVVGGSAEMGSFIDHAVAALLAQEGLDVGSEMSFEPLDMKSKMRLHDLRLPALVVEDS